MPREVVLLGEGDSTPPALERLSPLMDVLDVNTEVISPAEGLRTSLHGTGIDLLKMSRLAVPIEVRARSEHLRTILAGIRRRRNSGWGPGLPSPASFSSSLSEMLLQVSLGGEQSVTGRTVGTFSGVVLLPLEPLHLLHLDTQVVSGVLVSIVGEQLGKRMDVLDNPADIWIRSNHKQQF